MTVAECIPEFSKLPVETACMDKPDNSKHFQSKSFEHESFKKIMDGKLKNELPEKTGNPERNKNIKNDNTDKRVQTEKKQSAKNDKENVELVCAREIVLKIIEELAGKLKYDGSGDFADFKNEIKSAVMKVLSRLEDNNDFKKLYIETDDKLVKRLTEFINTNLKELVKIYNKKQAISEIIPWKNDVVKKNGVKGENRTVHKLKNVNRDEIIRDDLKIRSLKGNKTMTAVKSEKSMQNADERQTENSHYRMTTAKSGERKFQAVTSKNAVKSVNVENNKIIMEDIGNRSDAKVKITEDSQDETDFFQQLFRNRELSEGGKKGKTVKSEQILMPEYGTIQETVSNTSSVSENRNFSGVVKTQDIVWQVMEKVKVILEGDKSEMIMDLKPDHLGKLSLKVVTERGIVMARFVAESEQVKSILESNMQLLKDALEKQGLDVQDCFVSVDKGEKEGYQQDGRYNNFSHTKGSTAANGEKAGYDEHTGGLKPVQYNMVNGSRIDLTA